MFKPLNTPSILFSKNTNNSKIISTQLSKKNEKKVKVIPKFFQKGTFKREI